MAPRIVVVGSVNLDLVVRGRAPARAGGDGRRRRRSRACPGGKGANQAVACARLGAEVTMIARGRARPVRRRGARRPARGRRDARARTRPTEPTGVALIQVDDGGETTIVVAPGANAALGAVELPPHDAVLCQLEVPDEAVLSAWEACSGLFCLNAAPARARSPSTPT